MIYGMISMLVVFCLALIVGEVCRRALHAMTNRNLGESVELADPERAQEESKPACVRWLPTREYRHDTSLMLRPAPAGCHFFDSFERWRHAPNSLEPLYQFERAGFAPQSLEFRGSGEYV